MTEIIECVQRNGHMKPISDKDKKALARWLKNHSDGEVYEVIFADIDGRVQPALEKKFWALCGRYAGMLNLTNDQAEIELKHFHGVKYTAARAPVGRLGQKVNYHGTMEWQLSIVDYTIDELERLVRGTDATILEASV